MARKKREDVRDADQVIRDYYEGGTEDSSRDDGTEPVSSIENPQGPYTARSPVLSGGDMDAAWEQADVGTETVGGSNPTPDQDIVDEVGKAVGIEYQDNEPLKFGDKMAERDERRWELNPASSEDYQTRTDRAEGEAPPQPEPSPRRNTRSGSSKSAAARASRARQAGTRRRAR
ncbi:DUF6335 family protein [Nitrospira moscoviensis]|uniref:Uncharacterized protein n=1 Tax=Nitrospira moscoviensis TaxID=42253 RepID=A0A0K2GD09_NITMO|nr:DUF6335 family protein [Nitrospira moscoviensis]ALA58754.1 hypothetical protein NITMOv2_2339 [Nitrospira moscoviensis]